MKLLTYSSLFPNRMQPVHGIFVYQRMAHFARRPGNQVTVVAPVPWVPEFVSNPKYQRVREIPEQEIIGSMNVFHPRYLLVPRISMPLHGLLMFLGSFRLVKRLHDEHHFVGIDAHYVYPDGFAAVLIGRMLGLPVVVSARGTDMNLFPKFRLIRPLIRWTVRCVTGGIGVSKLLQEAMIEMGLPRERAVVIGNGIDLQRFQPVERRNARARLSMPENAVVLVAVGALIPAKGMQFLIPAFASVAKNEAKCHLYIIGDGTQRRELETLTEQHGVAGRVHFVGARPNEELLVWYSAADLSCLVSSREGWPNVLLESLACGTPVVATGVGGVPQVIVSPELGVLVEQNVESIAQGLKTAMEREWNRETLIQYARSRTWDVVAEELERFLTAQLAPTRTTAILG
jgi:glycosyltransferase involved in cell wall biosynthesis